MNDTIEIPRQLNCGDPFAFQHKLRVKVNGKDMTSYCVSYDLDAQTARVYEYDAGGGITKSETRVVEGRIEVELVDQ